MSDPRAWHDFFMLTGAAAATLAGLVFVAISFAIGAKAERTEGDLSAWVTPALIYFGEVFAASAASVAPVSPHVLGVVVLVAPLVAIPYGVWRLRFLLRTHREEKLEVGTWAFQMILPMLAHASIAGGGALILLDERDGQAAIAAAVCVLIACAVRNSWTLVVWLLEQRATSS